MVGTIYALIPAILTILLVIITRRVILSLGVGVICAALILSAFSIGDTISTLLITFSSLVIEED
ncbi:MAG: sodium:proton antiporter, partial [Turicibacter sanguinis]